MARGQIPGEQSSALVLKYKRLFYSHRGQQAAGQYMGSTGMSHGRSSSTVISLFATVPLAAMIMTASPAFAIDEIVVKTRKTEENLQDVPLAITTVSAQVLERTGASGLEDITKFSPSFIFDQNSAQKDVRIAVRGLSATRGRSNVAFLVDGIDVTSEAIGTAGAGLLTSQRLLSDVQQVEAVKGPQSALFGRAAFAGAINYVTKDSPDEFEASISADIAQYEEYSLSGSVGAPINDTMGWIANGYWFDEEGQYGNWASPNYDPLGGGSGYGGSLTFNWTPTDTLDIKARIEYIDEEYDDLPRARYINDTVSTSPNPGSRVLCEDGDPVGDPCETRDFEGSFPGTFGDASTAITPLRRGEDPRSYCVPTGEINPLNGQPTYDCDLSRTPSGYENASEQELFRASLVANWDVEAIKGTLSSLTGYIDSETRESYDWDAWSSKPWPDNGPPPTGETVICDAELSAINGCAVGLRLAGTHDIFNDDTVEIFSQEFRYRSDFEGPINFTLGAQYWTQERVQIEQGILSGYRGGEDGWQADFINVIESGANIRTPREVEDEHYSLYGLIEWQVNESWKVSLENRYSDEKFSQSRGTVIKPALGNNLAIGDQDCSFTPAGSPAAFNCFTQDYLLSIIESDDFLATFNRCTPEGDFLGTCFIPTPYLQQLDADVTSKFNTPKVTIEWTPNDDSLYYLSVAKAVKPAGIDVLGGGGPPVESDVISIEPGDPDPRSTEEGYNEALNQVLTGYVAERQYDSEKLWAYELGAKNTFDGKFGTLVLNSALFFQDFSDKQVSIRVFNPATGTTQRKTANAGSAEVWGVEFEGAWLTPVEGLSFTYGYTWLDTEYVEFDEATGSENTISKLGCLEVLDGQGNPAPDGDQCLVSRAGKELERAPEHAVALGFNYTQPLIGTDLDYFIEGNGTYQSDRFSDPENTTKFESYSIVDLRFGIEADQWEALVFIDNVFENDTVLSGSEIPDFASPLANEGAGPAPSFVTLGILPDKRQVGLRVKYNFN
jgi:outer membrane receptor protein involved in Fe transport